MLPRASRRLQYGNRIVELLDNARRAKLLLAVKGLRVGAEKGGGRLFRRSGRSTARIDRIGSGCPGGKAEAGAGVNGVDQAVSHGRMRACASVAVRSATASSYPFWRFIQLCASVRNSERGAAPYRR